MYNGLMDYFYTRFLKGIRQDNLKYLDLVAKKKFIKALSKQYHPTVFLCCYMPKVASTYLFSVLKELTGYRNYPLFSHALQNEQNIDYDEILKISQQHYMSKIIAKGTTSNIEIIDALSIKPFIITRPISDIIISLKDHFSKDFNKNNLAHLWPQLHLNNGFSELSDIVQYDMIIDHFTPWFIDFLNSWMDAETILGPLLWLTYDDITSDLKNTLLKLSSYYDISIDIKNLNSISKNAKSEENYFNKGKVGRGKKCLSKDQQDRLYSFFRHQSHLEQYIGI
tara:strand:+ start:561 stop:1403 length:843 start_codon:yes stop_codon:yes gene_type:complete